MNNINIKKIISGIFSSILLAIVGTILLAYCFGFRAFLVVGWSSEPYIPIYSLIIDYKGTSLNDLEVGDFITCTNSSGASYVTHRIVAIKKDGYFTSDEQVTIYKDGNTKTFDRFANISTLSSVIPENCNIITQQMTDESEGIDKPCELYNYQNNFSGKVTKVLPKTGRFINYIRNNFIMVISAVVIFYLGLVFLKYKPDYVRLF